MSPKYDNICPFMIVIVLVKNVFVPNMILSPKMVRYGSLWSDIPLEHGIDSGVTGSPGSKNQFLKPN